MHSHTQPASLVDHALTGPRAGTAAARPPAPPAPRTPSPPPEPPWRSSPTPAARHAKSQRSAGGPAAPLALSTAAEIVMLFGLARRTARQIEKVPLFYQLLRNRRVAGAAVGGALEASRAGNPLVTRQRDLQQQRRSDSKRTTRAAGVAFAHVPVQRIRVLSSDCQLPLRAQLDRWVDLEE